MSTKEKHLYYLTELKDYKVSSKDPDIRSWEVRDLDNRVIGKVDNLLVNKKLGKVVYVDVEIDEAIIDINHDPYAHSSDSEFREFINKEGENHIIIPIGLIDLNLDKKYVFTESINYQTFSETKRYKSGTTISRDYEHHVLNSYDRRKDLRTDDHQVERTASAYSTDELDHRDHDRIQETRKHDDARHYNESSSEMERRIQREKENLKYTSNDRSRIVDDKEYDHQKSDRLRPERTYDEDENWEQDRRRYEEKNSDENFYDRREFRDRDRR